MRRASAVICVVALLALSFSTASAIDPPKKPVWPAQFTARFGLNAVKTPISAPIINATGWFYYDWNQKANTIVYPETCIPVPIKNPTYGKPCNLTFNDKGTYLFTDDLCCFLFPGVGPLPPAFLDNMFKWSGLAPFPAADYHGELHMSNFWVTDVGFHYWTDADNGQDIALVDGGKIVWNFDQDFVVNKPQPAGIYDVPSKCSNLCPFFAGKNEPIVKLSQMHAAYMAGNA